MFFFDASEKRVILMQKIDMNKYLDELAVQAGEGNPAAKEELCRHFKKYIHNLARSYNKGWDAEDAEQDLWVCFLECLLSYDRSRKIHFQYYVLKHLKWKLMNFHRAREQDKKYVSGDFIEEPCLSQRTESTQILTEEETERVLEKCPLSQKQRGMIRQRLSGKSYKDMAAENRMTLRNVYYHMGRIQSACAKNQGFQESFFA